MNEEEIRKSVERANSYRDMMGLWAWKDFESILDWYEDQSFKDLKVLSSSSGYEFEVGKLIGRMKVIDDLRDEVNRIISFSEKK